MDSTNKTTVLPDGSAFFTADIMSREEALALPLKDRPLCFRISSEMYHAVFEAIGEASMCWNPRPSNEVFSSEEASNVAVRLCCKIAGELEREAVVGKEGDAICPQKKKLEGSDSTPKFDPESVEKAFDELRSILKDRSRGEVETWGFVAAFMDMIDEAQKRVLSDVAGQKLVEVET